MSKLSSFGNSWRYPLRKPAKKFRSGSQKGNAVCFTCKQAWSAKKGWWNKITKPDVCPICSDALVLIFHQIPRKRKENDWQWLRNYYSRRLHDARTMLRSTENQL